MNNLASTLFDTEIQFRTDKKGREYLWVPFRAKFKKEELVIWNEKKRGTGYEVYGALIYTNSKGFTVRKSLCTKFKTKKNKKEILHYKIVPVVIVKKTKKNKLRVINIEHKNRLYKGERCFNVKYSNINEIASLCMGKFFNGMQSDTTTITNLNLINQVATQYLLTLLRRLESETTK